MTTVTISFDVEAELAADLVYGLMQLLNGRGIDAEATYEPELAPYCRHCRVAVPAGHADNNPGHQLVSAEEAARRRIHGPRLAP